LTLVIIIERL